MILPEGLKQLELFPISVASTLAADQVSKKAFLSGKSFFSLNFPFAEAKTRRRLAWITLLVRANSYWSPFYLFAIMVIVGPIKFVKLKTKLNYPYEREEEWEHRNTGCRICVTSVAAKITFPFHLGGVPG